jgi:hypothetical protein
MLGDYPKAFVGRAGVDDDQPIQRPRLERQGIQTLPQPERTVMDDQDPGHDNRVGAR